MENRLAATIRSIGSEEFYRNLADYLRICISYDNIIAMIWHGTTQPLVLHTDYRGENVFRRLEEDYLSAAYQLDPFFRLHVERHAAGIYRLLEIAPDNFSRSKYFQWYYGDLGITDEITLFCPVTAQATATVSIGKSGPSEKSFTARAERRLRQHEPVFMALIEAHWSNQSPSDSPSRPEPVLSERLKKAMLKNHGVRLSNRQSQVAVLILQGHSSESASLKLEISPQTVKVFRKQLYKRCNISSQAELFSLMMPLLEKRTN